ncbi:unnamed protein product [Rotaria sordida]|uniref:Inositol polyphosphate-related phosphatase domain-containing protein n=2 Tax=Rotaria sordida TaxID=392033 RepID=A0A818M1Q8_9BILA|nr:unnamed protein product [Rotaria sordida]CAF0916404.1 unnamed protein product [Rotaria sordida]CAF3585400.1 unnamed protein product [Rotaria sordida]
MTDHTEQKSPTNHSTFSIDPVTSTESTVNDTIAALINSTPLVDSNTLHTSRDNSPQTLRRRSSVSIIQALANTRHLLTTNDARKRNFLVGTARQLPENTANDINSFFPSGRLLTIMMVTWNTGEASKLYEQNYTPTARQTAQPKERMLDDICDILLPTFIDYVSDLIIVCTQEMSVAKKRTDWEILLQEVIGPAHVLYHSVHFGTLSLCIFLRRDLIWFCTEPEEDIIKFRAVGPVRTKGSLVITFNLFGTSFMIINSHFEAGHGSEGRTNRRLNFHNTTTKLSIPHEFIQRTFKSMKRTASAVESSIPPSLESTASIDSTSRAAVDITKSCDCVLWAGDMNFRIDMPHDQVLELCKERNFREILLKDEFRIAQMKNNDLYANFKEADIDFAPTYKFDLRYDDDTYAKHRTPSYTDRILYRDKPTSLIECTQYKSVEGVKHSDHKPVVAHFRVKLKPGLHTGNLSYGKFNHDVYKSGCKQRERHHSLGVGFGHNAKRRTAIPKSSVCVLQ